MTDVTRACDTCKHLKVPANPDHAKHYRVCTVVTPLPANMHVWNRASMEGRVEGADRWITTHCVETKLGLKDCELHAPLDGKDEREALAGYELLAHLGSMIAAEELKVRDRIASARNELAAERAWHEFHQAVEPIRAEIRHLVSQLAAIEACKPRPVLILKDQAGALAT